MKLFLAALPFLALSPAAVLAQDAGKAEPAKPAQTAPAEVKKAEPALKQDAAAQKLWDESKDAVKKLKNIVYTVKQQTDYTGGSQGANGQVTFTMAEKPGMMPFTNYRIVLNDEKGAAVSEWAFDGKSIFKADLGAKKFFTIESAKAGNAPPQDLWPILPQWLMEDMHDNPQMKVIGIEFGEDVTVGDTKCKVIKRTASLEFPSRSGGEPGKVSFVTTRAVAEDKLPRKMVTTTEVNADGQEQKFTQTTELTKVKADAKLAEDFYTMKAPEGFKAEAGTFDNMGLQDPSGSSPELKFKEGDAAPDFKLSDTAGKEVTMAGLKGRVVLLDFWATWCGPCKAAMPSIQKIHEKFAGKDVTVIGVNCWERGDAPKYMSDQKYTYTCLLKGDDLAKAYGVSGIPTLILIDTEGKVIHTGVGFGDGEEEHLGKLIDEALAKKK